MKITFTETLPPWRSDAGLAERIADQQHAVVAARAARADARKARHRAKRVAAREYGIVKRALDRIAWHLERFARNHVVALGPPAAWPSTRAPLEDTWARQFHAIAPAEAAHFVELRAEHAIERLREFGWRCARPEYVPSAAFVYVAYPGAIGEWRIGPVTRRTLLWFVWRPVSDPQHVQHTELWDAPWPVREYTPLEVPIFDDADSERYAWMTADAPPGYPGAWSRTLDAGGTTRRVHTAARLDSEERRLRKEAKHRDEVAARTRLNRARDAERERAVRLALERAAPRE